MEAGKPLTAANLRYLLALRRLSGGVGAGVRSVRVAEELGLTKSSVHTMFRSFQAMGLIRKDAYGSAFFTPAGRALADRYYRYFQAARGLLAARVPPGAGLDDAACALLATLSQESLEHLCRERGRPVWKG